MPYNDIFADWEHHPTDSPSVTGALPSFPSPELDSANPVTFYLTSFNPDVLNCTILGPRQKVYYTTVTDKKMPNYTVVKDASSRSVGLLEWSSTPHVELRGVRRHRVTDCIKLSRDKLSRTMDFKGTHYVWAPEDQYLTLYSKSASPRILARICRGQCTITLDVAPEAIRLALLEAIITATVLFQSGMNID